MTVIHVEGMKCKHCAANAQNALEALGARTVQVDLERKTIEFEGDVPLEAIREAITAKGYQVMD